MVSQSSLAAEAALMRTIPMITAGGVTIATSKALLGPRDKRTGKRRMTVHEGGYMVKVTRGKAVRYIGPFPSKGSANAYAREYGLQHPSHKVSVLGGK